MSISLPDQLNVRNCGLPLSCSSDRMHLPMQEQEPLIENLDRDTEGVSNRMSAAMHKLQDVIKKMNFCTQMGVVIVLIVVLIVMLYFTFSD